MPIIETEQQTNQNVISGQEYLDAGATKELVGQLRGYAEGYNDGYDAGAAAGGSSGSGGSATAYAWVAGLGLNAETIYTNFPTSPADKNEFDESLAIQILVAETSDQRLIVKNSSIVSCGAFFGEESYTKIDSNAFKIAFENASNEITFVRDSTKDFTLW